jgi:hypothetical protein
VSRPGKLITWFSLPAGLVGALPPSGMLFEEAGLIIVEMSWHEMAADLRCRWPGLPAGGPRDGLVFGGGSMPSPLIGLVLIKPNPVPEIPSPPINSLPPLLCPPGRDGMVLADPGELGDSGGLAIPVPA